MSRFVFVLAAGSSPVLQVAGRSLKQVSDMLVCRLNVYRLEYAAGARQFVAV
jgi:hypothetical protein